MFSRLTDPYSPFYIYGTKLFNILILNVLWVSISFFSGGILLGISTIGLFLGVHVGITHSHGFSLYYFFRPYKYIKSKFKLFFLSTFFLSLAIALISFNIYYIWDLDTIAKWLLPLYIFMLFELVLTAFYTYPLIIHTHNIKTKELYKLAFALGNKHIATTLLCFLILSISLFIIYVYSVNVLLIPILLILPSLSASLINYLVYNWVFSKYTFVNTEENLVKE